MAFAIWAAVAAGAVHWALQWSGAGGSLSATPAAEVATAAPRGDWSKVLGVTPVVQLAAEAVPPQASRLRLIGVVAPRGGKSAGAVALIAVDGKPARAFGLGAEVIDSLRLRSVEAGRVLLSPRDGDGPSVELVLPPLPQAATGTLSAGPTAVPTVVPPMPIMAPVPTPISRP